jgi:hypothetical protein
MSTWAQPGAPPAAWQGPLFKDDQAKKNSTIRLEHRNSDTPVNQFSKSPHTQNF